MVRGGKTLDELSTDLSPPHLKTLPVWTPWRDDIALGDAAVRERMRFLFTPLAVPTLSAEGARAGLGPEGPTGASRDGRGTADIATRPEPRLNRPIAARLPNADISEAAQIAAAERMGLHVPVEAPTLSSKGAMAGLGPFSPSSSSKKAKSAAMATELAGSVAKVRLAARKATAMEALPVPALSDRSRRAGITGKGPIAAASKGFEMRLPKGPLAQDRERWASGTQARISAASKGLGLPDMAWGDHGPAPAKPEPKRTWVGVQGDATECVENCTTACADLAVPSRAAVDKAPPKRELEKERVPSDACPPIPSGPGSVEAPSRCDAAMAPGEILRNWQVLSPLPTDEARARVPPASHTAGAVERLQKKSSTREACACNDCARDETRYQNMRARDQGAPGAARSTRDRVLSAKARRTVLRLLLRAATVRGMVARRG
jgi:hypothetical protein